jgi:hypothetical protein
LEADCLVRGLSDVYVLFDCLFLPLTRLCYLLLCCAVCADVSLFFTNLMIVKVFTAVPLEMIRPWQLSTIQLLGNSIDRRRTTRRELRTGVFFSQPMTYGWSYPQLMMVLMIMLTYSVITPFIMPLCW